MFADTVPLDVIFPTATLPTKLLLPEATYNAYGLVCVTLVPAIGAPAIYNVDEFVNVTDVLRAAIVGIPIACAAALDIVELAATRLSVYVLATNLSPKLPVGVETLAFPDAAPEIVCELPNNIPAVILPVPVINPVPNPRLPTLALPVMFA